MEKDNKIILAEIRDLLASLKEQIAVLEKKIDELETAPDSMEAAPVVAAPAANDAVEEAPAVEEIPAVEDEPVVEQTSVVEEVPVVEEAFVGEAPVAEDVPAVEDIPVAEDVPEVPDAPVAEEDDAFDVIDIMDGIEEPVQEAEEERPFRFRGTPVDGGTGVGTSVLPELGSVPSGSETTREVEAAGESSSFDIFGQEIVSKPQINDAQRRRRSINDTMTRREAWRDDMPGSPVKDIRSAISLNDRAGYINNLFSGDPMAFQSAINSLNMMASFDQAVEYLRTQYPKWNFESDYVYRFMMAIRRRFN